MEKTVLLLEKRGCNFGKDDKIRNLSDLENYRLFARGWQPKGTKKPYTLEITRGFRIRTTHKFNTEKKLKKYVVEHDISLRISTQFEDDAGVWCDLKLEDKFYEIIYDRDLKFNKNSLLTVLNTYGRFKIDHILIVDNVYGELEKISGYREKTILEKCVRTTETLNTNEHHVIKFYDVNSNSFEYDLISKKIVG